MAELGDMLGKLLDDPENVKMVSSLLGALSSEPPSEHRPKPSEQDSPPPKGQPSKKPPSKPSCPPGEPDMEKISKLLKMWNGPPDERCRLLMALKPFVSPPRRGKIDQCIKMLKLLEIAEKMGGLGLV